MSKHVVSETDTVAETEFFKMSDEADCVGVDRPLGEAVSGRRQVHQGAAWSLAGSPTPDHGPVLGDEFWNTGARAELGQAVCLTAVEVAGSSRAAGFSRFSRKWRDLAIFPAFA